MKKTDNIDEIYFDDTKSSSEKYQDHIPFGYSYKLVCIDDRFTEDTVVYRPSATSEISDNQLSKDCVKHFINQMLVKHEYCKNIKSSISIKIQ